MSCMDESLLSDAIFLRGVLDAVPSPLFIVDTELRILHFNASASQLLGPGTPYLKRGGEALHCLHSTEAPEGCGYADACRECVIRESVGKAIGGSAASRIRTKLNIIKGKELMEVQILVTASPFSYEGDDLSILILEDVTELIQLRGLIPICAWCKKVRNEKEYWESIEEYFSKNLELDFTHGICEQCAAEHLRQLEEEEGH